MQLLMLHAPITHLLFNFKQNANKISNKLKYLKKGNEKLQENFCTVLKNLSNLRV